MGRNAEARRWRCNNCGAITANAGLLTAPSPFDPSDILTACPRCLCCDEGFALLCDEPWCNREARCGWPTGNDADAFGGYRQTCHNHFAAAPIEE